MRISQLLPEVQKNILLKDYTTFKIGGPAKYFFIAKTKEDLILAITAPKKLKIPFFILGGGSNLLAADKGFKGLVIKTQNTKYKIQNTKIIAGAGAPLGLIANTAAKSGLTGLEWAAGIPGTVGGAIYGNAGSFGKSMEDIVKEVEVFDAKTEEINVFKNKDCQFGYRHSVFKKNRVPKLIKNLCARRFDLIILSAELRLKKGKKKEIQKKIKEYLNYKKEKQPLNYPSAGSIFKNPRNFSAGELIEKCKLKKETFGGAKISEKHANFIVNLGQGKAEDVKKLINLMKKRVKQKFRLVLKEEIEYL